MANTRTRPFVARSRKRRHTKRVRKTMRGGVSETVLLAIGGLVGAAALSAAIGGFLTSSPTKPPVVFNGPRAPSLTSVLTSVPKSVNKELHTILEGDEE